MTARGLGLLLLLGATCYNPKIDDGTLRCSATYECPTGMVCNMVDGLCYHKGVAPMVGGTDGSASGGAGGMGTGGAGGVCMAGTGVYGPIAGCSAKIDMTCDPVCQAGCGCSERCKLEGGTPVCRAEAPPFTQIGESCDANVAADHCRPGSLCLQENLPACGAHCYRHCRTDADCPGGAKCNIPIAFGQTGSKSKACGPPPEDCKPYGQARCSQPVLRPSPTFGCYVITNFPDLVACDCAGTTKMGEACKEEHECEPGAECVAIAGQTTAICRRVCVPGAIPAMPAMGGCPVGQTCTLLQNSTKYGYCH